MDANNCLRERAAQRLLRTVSALATQQLRVHYLRTELSALDIFEAAGVLELICAEARGASRRARVLMVALAAMTQDPAAEGLVLALRLAVEDQPDSPLRPLLCVAPPPQPELQGGPDWDDEARVPDYGKGRTLTLGERKSLARKPTRALFDKLLGDPDPAVIHVLLTNPLTTEDDVVRLAARRPLRAELIVQIVRHPRWNVRRRVRLALVLNPYTPAALGVPLVGLLLRSELRMTVDGPETNGQIRAAAAERLRQIKARARP